MARYIDADKLIEQGWHLEKHAPNGRCLTMMSIADVPTADVVEVKHGKWIKNISYPMVGYKCSECDNFEIYKSPFCRVCGAKMDGGNSNG